MHGVRKTMIKNSAKSISSYKFTNADKLLIDANIWLYLFPAPSSAMNYATRVYSAAFKAMIDSGATLLINSLILSEYLNRYCRIEWQAIYRNKFSDYKKFRQSPDYTKVGANAAAFARKILRYTNKLNDEFVTADVRNILSNFESGAADFNDGLIIENCAQQRITLVTHDGDFVLGGVDILTDNKKLLIACS
jgi:predicted nucleic acid-binding protein